MKCKLTSKNISLTNPELSRAFAVSFSRPMLKLPNGAERATGVLVVVRFKANGSLSTPRNKTKAFWIVCMIATALDKHDQAENQVYLLM